jgi:uncharacterized protein YndB with AHSA1/START domain
MVSEEVVVAVPPATVYAAVSDIKRMARWSPECFAIWRWSGGRRFVGWNRRGLFVWFTTCQVTTDQPAREYAFDVSTFGMPVARWGYRFDPSGAGTLVTEYWEDRRTRGASILGRIFTGKVVHDRPAANRVGMRETLARLKAELEAVDRR